MKKLLSLTLAVLMLMTLMSCTPKKKTAYEIITDAQTKMTELGSIDLNMDMNLTLGSQGITFSIPASMDIKAAELLSDSPKAKMNIEMSYMGITISLELYYADEYLYLSAMGQNAKFNTKELTDTLPDKDLSAEVETYQEEYNKMLEVSLAEVEVQENEDKSKTVSYIINGEQMTAFLNKLFEDAATDEETTAILQSSEFKCSDAEITQTVNKDGYLTVSDIKCTLTIIEDLGETGEILGMETMEASYDMDITATINNPGEPVEVTPMEGYESFEEVSPDESLPEDIIF